jgi:hypothetical protein
MSETSETSELSIKITPVFTSLENVFIVVDEVHKANKKICNLINKFTKGIVMSATIPHEITEQLANTTPVKIPLSYGIENKHIVDYTLWFPHLKQIDETKTEVDVDIPMELSAYNRDFVAKSLYLATGMLKTGSRRCLAYMSTMADCRVFIETVSKVFKEYHGLQIWCEYITSDTPVVERKRILDEFENKNTDDVIHILASIRILDEAVDLVRCDSEFISTIGSHSSDIVLTQRAFRGSRLDPKNPLKHNNVFIWADGWEQCVNALSRLKQEDVEFSKKMKICDSNYCRGNSRSEKEKLEKTRADFMKHIQIKCITREEKIIEMCERIMKIKEEKGRWPSLKLERTEAEWICYIRYIYKKNNNIPLIIQSNYKELYSHVIMFKRNTHYENAIAYIKFYEKYRQIPKRGNNNNTLEYILAKWMSRYKQVAMNNIENEKVNNILTQNILNWKLSANEKKLQNINNCIQWCKQNNKLPKRIATNKKEKTKEEITEYKYALLLIYIKTEYKKTNSSLLLEQINILNTNLPGWDDDVNIKNEKYHLDMAKKLIKWIKINKKIPKRYKNLKKCSNNIQKEEYKLYNWFSHMKSSINKLKNSNTSVIKYLDENLIGWRENKINF